MRKLLLVLSFFAAGTMQAQNTWLSKAPFGGGARNYASGFSIGNTGYILSGSDEGSYFEDMWAWNMDSNSWTEMASYPGGERTGTRSVSLNGLGYVMGGEHPGGCFAQQTKGMVCGGTFYNDLWRYNPDSNTWTIDTAFPGAGRNFAVALSDPDDSTIYYGTGNADDSAYFSDWWAFYAPTHTWTKMANFPGGQRDNAVGFFANGNIYVGTGDSHNAIDATNDFWQYTPSTNTWVRIADVPGMPIQSASTFSIGNYGYVCLGLNDSAYTSGGWRYNTANNEWRPITNYSGGMTGNGVAFTIDSNGYVGTGSFNDSTYSQYWEYTFDNSSSLGVTSVIKTASISIYPNPAKSVVTISYSGLNNLPATLTFIDMLGNVVSTSTLNNTTGQTTLDVSALSSGIYLYQFTGAGNLLKTGKLIIAK